MKDRARESYLEDLEEAKEIGRESLRVEMRDKVKGLYRPCSYCSRYTYYNQAIADVLELL